MSHAAAEWFEVLSRDAAESSTRSITRGTLDIGDALVHDVTTDVIRGTGASTLRATGETTAHVAEEETKALKGANNVTNNHFTPDWKATLAKTVPTVVGVGVGGFIAHNMLWHDAEVLGNAGKDAVTALGTKLERGTTNLYEHAKEAEHSLVQRAEGAIHKLPGMSTLGTVTGSVTMLLVVGLVGWGAFEIYSFSR